MDDKEDVLKIEEEVFGKDDLVIEVKKEKGIGDGKI